MLRKDGAMNSTNTSTTIYDKEEELLASTKKATITTTSMNTNSRNSFVTSIKNQEDQLINSTKCQIVEAKEENERLKWMLSKTMKDYKSLQMHFQGIITQNSNNIIAKSPSNIIEKEEVEHLSLSLGRSSSRNTSKEFKKELYDQNDEFKSQKNCKLYDGLDLGLDCKFSQDHLTDDHSPENSFEESNKENIKMARISRNHDEDEEEDFWDKKKARVSIRAVCGTTTMNDGCQWRKYGQKIAKGNPCPRAYYRCTVSPTCPVRKQVQRCCEDMSILITTYEGTHNHSLPFSATAMASTTSAAASMLRCTSSSTSPLPQQSGLPNVNQNLHGKFNFTNSNSNNLLPTYNNNASTFYLAPKTSISTCQSHPTITLDFTTNTSLSSTHHTLISSQRYPFNSLKFSTPISPSTSSTYLGRPCFSHQPLMITSKNNQNTIECSGEIRNSDDQIQKQCESVTPRI